MLVWVPFQHTHALSLSLSLSLAPFSSPLLLSLLLLLLLFAFAERAHFDDVAPGAQECRRRHRRLTHDRSGASCCCCANFGDCCPSQSGPAIRERRLLPGRQAGRPSLTGKFPRSKSGVNESGLGFTSLATSLFLSFSVSLCDMRCNQDGYFLPSQQFDPFCRSPTEVVVTC